MTTGQKIRAAREAKGWSQARLARAIGTDDSTISRYESDNRAVSLRRLSLIAKALGVAVHDLLGDEVEKRPA
ncbi:MAG: helix-turn-helix transcriptional regulator [Firmicutes bacterium]|nr:helix-turn-helix transcriptional regulator [Bacillota bacterium]MBE3590866.1 helix-turn-helix transcriptional regulator [Bacillota bacterium]